jgi:hypothetical protein
MNKENNPSNNSSELKIYNQYDYELSLTEQSITSEKSGLFNLINSYDGFDTQFSYLIKGYLPTCSLGMVYGASGSYKSFHTLSWAVHVALGKEWNGCNVNQTNVLYIAGEGGVGVAKRIKALADTYNYEERINNLYRLDYPISLGNVFDVNQLIDTINQKSKETKQQFGLIIIDTLARCFGHGDENSTEQMNRFVTACDRIKSELNATILIVHHSGVSDKERARGSSALRAACDFEYRIERTNDEVQSFKLIPTKNKDEIEMPRQVFPLSSVTLFFDEDGDAVTSLVASSNGLESSSDFNECSALTANEQCVYQIIRSRVQLKQPITREVIRDDLKAQKVDTNNLKRWLDACIRKGVVMEEDGQYFTVTNY